MKLSQFKFNLPSELIALQPTQNRDEARLMVVDRRTGKIEHRIFKDLVDYTKDGDVFVINNTKVFPAKLYGEKEKTGAKIEVLLLRELDHESRLWDVLVDPARKIRIGNKLYFGEGDELVAEVIDNTTSRGRTLRFLFDGTYDEFKKTLSSLGHTPIPKELNREERPEDAEDFQTIYAKVEGAVSAPNGQLPRHRSGRPHQTQTRLGRDVHRRGMLQPGQRGQRPPQQRVCRGHHLAEGPRDRHDHRRHKFIFPPYTFSVANCMITNFHLPKSSMMMEVAAFAGYDLLMKAYKEAIAEKYRFFTYGDAMLII